MAGPSKIELINVLNAQEKVSVGHDYKIASNETFINTQNIILSASTSSGNLPSKKFKTCCKKLETSQLLCDVLQQKLRRFYKHLFLSKIAWLEEEREFPIQDYFIDLKLIDSDKKIKIEEIFNQVNEDKKSSRIYIEGQPGYGKTTFAHKLVNDWAMEKEYIGHFKLAFLLPLREIHGRSIEQTITSIGQLSGLDKNQNAIDIVNNHKNQTLFILDGLDEVSEEGRSLIFKTLYKLEYSEVTVIVFCKTGKFKLTDDEHEDLFKGASKSRYFHDRKISILGIDENKKKFIKKFLPTQDVDKIFNSLELNLEIFNSPLFLMLLIIIVSKKETNIGPFRNKTEFYKMLFNAIIKHHLIKSGNNIHTDFDLFQLNSEINETQSIIQKFGKLSLEKIAKNELQFESNDLTKQIYNSGFLINHRQITDIRSKNYYEAFHLSFLEFASAYALWIDLKLDKSNLENHILHFFANFRTSFVLIFLASLMQDNMDKFLSLIKPFSSYFSSAFNITITLFEDCTSINWNEGSNIIDFLPSVIDLTNFYKSSNVCKLLITHGSKYGKIKYIIISENTNPELIPNEISNNSQIIFQHRSWCSSYKFRPCRFYPLQIRYTKGHCIARDMVTQLKKLDSLSLKNQLKYIALLNTESCVLYLDNVDKCTQILKMTLEIQFKKIKFECLTVATGDDTQLQMIIKLIKKDQVENLKLTNNNRNGNLMNDLCGAAGQSTYLTSITVTESNIDLYHLTVGGTKYYHFIHLDNCTLSCSISLKQKNCCHHLKLTKSNNFKEIDAITEMEPKSLTCNSDLLGYLLRNYPNWNGFSSVKQLCLCQHSFKMKDADNICIDKKIISWNKLKTLYINVEYFHDGESNIENSIESYINSLIESDIEEKAIVKCVQMLGIKNFAIKTEFFRVDNLFKYFDKQKVCLNKIKLILRMEIPDKNYVGLGDLTELLNGIKCNHWMKVNVVCPLKFNEFLIYNSINQLNDFNVAHFSYGSRENDAYKLKTEFYPLTLADGTFCITKKL